MMKFVWKMVKKIFENKFIWNFIPLKWKLKSLGKKIKNVLKELNVNEDLNFQRVFFVR